MLGVVQAASDNAARLDANTNACFGFTIAFLSTFES